MHQHRHLFGNSALCRYRPESQMGPSLSRPGIQSVTGDRTVRDRVVIRCEGQLTPLFNGAIGPGYSQQSPRPQTSTWPPVAIKALRHRHRGTATK